jgi:hypothetical protein
MVRLWDPASGELIRILRGHQLEVLAVAFSSVGGQLATGSRDGTVRLWDAAGSGFVAQLSALPEGWSALGVDGAYKFEGEIAGELWWVAGLCRFEPGELDPYLSLVRRLPDNASLFS